MTRFEYLNTLRQGLEGLPPDVIAATVSAYERRIYEASAAGKTEEEILAGLGDPQALAAECRAKAQVKAFKQNKTPTNFFRMCFSLIGLMVFNLFLLIPTIVYSALLFAAYCVSLALYAGGIAVTAISLAGVNQISTSGSITEAPVPHVQLAVIDKDAGVKMKIGKDGKAVIETSAASAASSATAQGASATSSASATATPAVKITPNEVRVTDGSNKVRISTGGEDVADFEDGEHGTLVDLPGVHIYNPEDSDQVFFINDVIGASRPAQFFLGLALILGGVVAFLLCLAISRYSIIGMLRLAEMEFAVLKNA